MNALKTVQGLSHRLAENSKPNNVATGETATIAAEAAVEIKVLKDLDLMITAASIDIKVLSDLGLLCLLRVYYV